MNTVIYYCVEEFVVDMSKQLPEITNRKQFEDMELSLSDDSVRVFCILGIAKSSYHF